MATSEMGRRFLKVPQGCNALGCGGAGNSCVWDMSVEAGLGDRADEAVASATASCFYFWGDGFHSS